MAAATEVRGRSAVPSAADPVAAAVEVVAGVRRAAPDSLQLNDTIAAISTPPGRGGIGVVRLSGPQSAAIARSLIKLQSALQPRTATLGGLLDLQGHKVD